MNTATLILWVIALVLAGFAWSKGSDTLLSGLKVTWSTVLRNAVVLVFAFLIVGYVAVLSPTELVKNWIGPTSGLRGILVAELVGMLLPGGPYVVFPLIAVLYESGASTAAVITLVTSWSTTALLTLSFELPFMGSRFTLIRWGLGLSIPLLAGTAALLLL
jgi:uncharacterized membrane protein YraQ (UPF0718 family)